ncbi:MAG: cation transporter [Elusimicrobia bacterium]|nr:cation transporter [Elusimicrobiota bacterium]
MKPANHHEHPSLNHSKTALKVAIYATAAIFVVELTGGIWTHSLALLSDTAHVFMDLLSFVLSLMAILLAERPVSDTRTFGLHRLEVFAAMTNGITIILMAALIFFHACARLLNPVPILSAEMLVIALIGLIVNLIVIWRLHPHLGKDVNMKSAYLHALGDAAASVAVVGGGILVFWTGNQRIDPMAAILISVIIVVSAFKILRDSFHILMEGAPKGLDRKTIVQSIEEIAGAESVKDLHIWNICSHLCALSLHLKVADPQMVRQKQLLETINLQLQQKFSIIHTTIQIESNQW